MKYFVYILLAHLLFFSCKKAENRTCFKTTGNEILESRSLLNFSNIVLSDNIELSLSQSNENKATIRTGKNLINFIETKVINDTLYISNGNKCDNLRSRKHKIIVDLNIINVRRINHYGTMGISSINQLKSDSLIVEAIDAHGEIDIDFEGEYFSSIVHSGTCNVSASGSVNQSYSYQISSGKTDYSKLNATTTHMHSRTVQDCNIFATEKIKVNIQGSGDVYYINNPDLIIELKGDGTGELIAQ